MQTSGLILLLTISVGQFGLLGCASPIEREPQPYAVGSTTIFVHDSSRPFDALGGVNTGERILITEIWYPADRDERKSARRATVGDYSFGEMSVHRLMMTKTSFFHLTLETVREGVSQQQIDAAIEELFHRPRGSYVDVPVAPSGGKFPVIVVTHGDAGSRYNMQTVSEYLASQGYVVVAPEHTGNSPFSFIGKDPALQHNSDLRAAIYPLLDERGLYATDQPLGQTYVPFASPDSGLAPAALQKLDTALVEQVDDLRTVLRHLEEMSETGFLAGRIDLQNVGVMGRSFGGGTTLVALALEDRFKAGVAVVPAVGLPDFRQFLPPESLVSASRESAFLHAGQASGLRQLHKPTLILSGAEDNVIIGLEQSLLSMSGFAEPTPDEPYPAIAQLLDNSDVPVLHALLANANHASLAYAGPYWWQQLKPDTFPRVLRSAEAYKLIAPELAHKIQREKALQFFDAYVKEDGKALRALEENPYGEEILRLRAKALLGIQRN